MKKLLKIVSSVALICLLFAYVPLLQDYYYYNYKGSSVVRITRVGNSDSGGTGFQIEAPSGKNYILTNRHVCKIADSFGMVNVETTEGESRILKVIKSYDKHDLCLIEPFEGLRPFQIAETIIFTEKVYLIGHPKLYNLTFEQGYYRGPKLIYLRDAVKVKDRVFYIPMPYPSASFNLMAYGGNSGSPIIDVYGNVVSVLFAGNPGSPNFTFGVPLEYIHKFLHDK